MIVSNKILIVDDDIVNLEILNLMLGSQGHHCVKAANGLEALEVLEKNSDTDIIILDLEMPVMDGFQMLVELKKKAHLKDIPVIVVSVKQCDVLKTLQLGANDFVSKPYAPEELEVRINNLISAKRAAESSQRSKNEFIAIVSHELRTPMNGILGMTDYLMDGEASPQQLESLGFIKESAHDLLKIINNILDFTNAEDGCANLAPLPFNVVSIIQQVLDEVKARVANKGLTLSFEVPPDIPETILGHKARIAKVLTNLVDNSIKFTTSGAIMVSMALESVTGDDIRLSCAVRDTGIGMTPEVQQLIFKPFVQADGSSIRRFGGIGLGLTTSQRLVESMGGKISVESSPGSGSTFGFTFNARLPEKSVSAALSPVARPLSILLAEDIYINQLVATRLIENSGHSVTVANNGAEAFAQWQQGGFDLIFMDIQMPEIDGYQATELIRAAEQVKGTHIPIIALTANALENDEMTCLKVGMDGYLTKPLKKEALLKAIAGVFENVIMV